MSGKLCKVSRENPEPKQPPLHKTLYLQLSHSELVIF